MRGSGNARAQNDEAGITRLHDAILQYVQRNPSAADTLRGVVNWWLPAQFQETETKIVEQAIERLVAEGAVKKTVLADGSVLFAGKAGRPGPLSSRKAGKSR